MPRRDWDRDRDRRGIRPAEWIVLQLRVMLRISGLPTPQDAWRVAGILADEVTVEVGVCARAFAATHADGTTVIGIPESLPNDAATEILLEELGHHLLDDSQPLFGSRRLRQFVEDREEVGAREFVLRWKLPSEVLWTRDMSLDEQLAWDTGCTLEEVKERRRWDLQ